MKTKLNIQNFGSADDAAKEAGKALSQLMLYTFENPILLLLSAGSAFKLLGFLNDSLFSEQLTIAMLDERFSTDAKVNNFAQLQDTDFYMKALEHDVNFFGTTLRVGDTKESLAARLEKNLRDWRKENSTGKIFATVGMGSDGHTAGIMPFPENPELFKKLFLEESWITAYDATGKNIYPNRVTATLSLLKGIDGAIGFISGEEKKPAFDKITSKQAALSEVPAMVFWEMKDLSIYTDIQII